MILYKLMNKDLTTHQGYKWELGVKQEITTPGNSLCSNQVFHAYKSPELAVLFNPIHADYKNPILIEIEGDIVADDGLKVGSKWQKPIKIIELPVIPDRQKIIFAILCAKAVSTVPIPEWDEWADNYLIGKINNAALAALAALAARDAWDAWTAWTAARTAKAALAALAARDARDARDALAARAAWDAARTARDAAEAAWTAWTAAKTAEAADSNIDFISIFNDTYKYL